MVHIPQNKNKLLWSTVNLVVLLVDCLKMAMINLGTNGEYETQSQHDKYKIGVVMEVYRECNIFEKVTYNITMIGQKSNEKPYSIHLYNKSNKNVFSYFNPLVRISSVESYYYKENDTDPLIIGFQGFNSVKKYYKYKTLVSIQRSSKNFPQGGIGNENILEDLIKINEEIGNFVTYRLNKKEQYNNVEVTQGEENEKYQIKIHTPNEESKRNKSIVLYADKSFETKDAKNTLKNKKFSEIKVYFLKNPKNEKEQDQKYSKICFLIGFGIDEDGKDTKTFCYYSKEKSDDDCWLKIESSEEDMRKKLLEINKISINEEDLSQYSYLDAVLKIFNPPKPKPTQPAPTSPPVTEPTDVEKNNSEDTNNTGYIIAGIVIFLLCAAIGAYLVYRYRECIERYARLNNLIN